MKPLLSAFILSTLAASAYERLQGPTELLFHDPSQAFNGYKDGVILGSSGHLRIVVSTRQVKVEYIGTDQVVAHAYVVPAAGGK